MGVLCKLADGTYDLEESKARYFAYSEDVPASNEIVLAKARLTEERARQTFLRFYHLRTKLLPVEVVRAFYEFHKVACGTALCYFSETVAAESIGIDDVKKMGLMVSREVEKAQTSVYSRLSAESLFDEQPQLKEMFAEPEYTFTLNNLESDEALRQSRLEKLHWLTELEKTRTGIMTGQFIPVDVFWKLFGGVITNAKARLTGIPTAVSPHLVGKDKSAALDVIREYADEVLDEVRSFSWSEYKNEVDGFMLSLNEVEGEESSPDQDPE